MTHCNIYPFPQRQRASSQDENKDQTASSVLSDQILLHLLRSSQMQRTPRATDTQQRCSANTSIFQDVAIGVAVSIWLLLLLLPPLA